MSYPKVFKCAICGSHKPTIKGLQPVPMFTFKTVRWCQYCYCLKMWGKDWAEKCATDQPELKTVVQVAR